MSCDKNQAAMRAQVLMKTGMQNGEENWKQSHKQWQSMWNSALQEQQRDVRTPAHWKSYFYKKQPSHNWTWFRPPERQNTLLKDLSVPLSMMKLEGHF